MPKSGDKKKTRDSRDVSTPPEQAQPFPRLAPIESQDLLEGQSTSRDLLNAMPNGGTQSRDLPRSASLQSRDLPNTMQANDGTAALQPAHAPIAVVEERDDQAEPISLEDVREQRNNTHLPWQPAWNDMHIKQRLYRMAEALDFPICEIAGIVEGGKAAWYNLCYEPGYIDEAAEAHDTLKLHFDH